MSCMCFILCKNFFLAACGNFCLMSSDNLPLQINTLDPDQNQTSVLIWIIGFKKGLAQTQSGIRSQGDISSIFLGAPDLLIKNMI